VEDDAGIEVHIRIEVALDEVRVAEGDLLQLHRDLQEWVGMGLAVEDLPAEALGDLCPRVVRLVDPVAEPVEAEGVVLVLGLGDDLFDGQPLGMDL